jgi:hypothetical protein
VTVIVFITAVIYLAKLLDERAEQIARERQITPTPGTKKARPRERIP